jgi:hypothetical protein
MFFFRYKFSKRQKAIDTMLKKSTNADVVFLLDCTGSMTPYIEQGPI